MILGALILSSATLFQGALAQDTPSQAAPSWEELNTRPFPEWFKNAKLGIFIHWGVYSVPAYSGVEDYGEWYLRGLQEGDALRTEFMREHYGEDFSYKDFAPLFDAKLFDADEWADLFRRAGAKYVVLVSKHHDGYALWPSEYSPGWNSMEVGPERNLVGELTFAVRKADLRMGFYYSLAEWNNPLHRWYTDPPDSIGPYVDQYMIPQFKELISAYKPEVLFTDGEWLNTAEQWHARELIDWYYRTVGPNAVVNDRWGAGSDIGFLTPEYSAGIEETSRPWAEVRGLGRSFGLNRNEAIEAYMSPEDLIHRFTTAVGSGGGMILNVGPKADGQIPLLQQERLLQLGQWMDVNWEAIYASRPWIKTGEDREVRFERIDPQIDFDWVRNSPIPELSEDDFRVAWTGFLEPEFTETYTFEAEADDGFRLWIRDDLILDNWGIGGPASEMEIPDQSAPDGRIRLRAGQRYPIRIEYYEGKQNASVRFFWSSRSRSREIVPQTQLYPSDESRDGNGLSAVYRSTERYLAYTQKNGDLFAFFYSWPNGELALPIPPPPSPVTIRLMGLNEELPWRVEGDQILVDLSLIPYEEIPGDWAWTIRLEGYADLMGEDPGGGT
jgi:alpha-L-fucosidase